jgi:uncharacterized phage protein gp47/JayE
LDDRKFDDIVDEAIRLIPRYCPEWTNHNPTDPGVTLIELFAWMTEMTLYRLNKVPEKTYLSLLELMGLSLVAPQSARAIVRFSLVEGYRKAVSIARGTQVAAITGDNESCVFETERDLVINESRLVGCVNRVGERWSERCDDGAVRPFTVFESTESVDHILYISSPSLAYLAEAHHVQVSFEPIREISTVREEIVNYLYWEYWNGRAWVHVDANRAIPGRKKKDDVVYFSGPLEIEPVEVAGAEGYYLRAILSELPEERAAISALGITVRTHFSGIGFMPDLCLTNSGASYAPVDLNGAFRIFSEVPSYNEIFYIAADEVFSNAGTKAKITFTFSEVYVPGGENDNAQFAYEYWDGTGWKKLTAKAGDLRDGTFGFKQSGDVSFVVPRNMAPVAVNNEERRWLRVRLMTKDFSIGGEYVKDDKDNWEWRFTSKVQSPVFSKVRITYESHEQIPERVVSLSNFNWTDLTGPLSAEVPEEGIRKEIALFSVGGEDVPSLNLGFSARFPKGDAAIYVRIDEGSSPKPRATRPSFFRTLGFREAEERRLLDLSWEYRGKDGWIPLSVNDYTDSFHESGFVEFAAPDDMERTREFGKDAYWLRVRLLSGSFESKPRIVDVALNAVYASNVKTYEDEIIGSGTGAPAQSASPAHGPILPGSVLYVDEGSIPPANELEAMRLDGIEEPYLVEGGAVWVRYREVENFYTSTGFSRHYIVDYRDNKIHFGDGQRGVNPPRRKFNLKLASYSVGGGSAGNVAAHTLKILTKSIPFVAECDNPYPAEGGADMETVDSLKSRAAGVFKSLERAVTAEDFQWLAREASSSVGRAHCLRERNGRGEICVAVIPVMPQGATLGDRLMPSRELMRRVTAYLDGRKLVGTKIRVQAPVYRTFNVFLTLVFKSDVLDAERLKKTIERSLRSYFHPLEGSPGAGWEFGKAITCGAVLKQLEKIEGILSVDETSLFDVDAGIMTEKIALKDDELAFLSEVSVESRREVS